MSALPICITTAGYAALVNAQNMGTQATLISRIGITEQAFDSSDAAAAAMTSLPGELKQLTTFAGDAVGDDTIHVTIRDDGPDTYSMRGFGLYLSDGTLLALYGQVDPILEKSAQAMLLLATDIRFTDVDVDVLEFGDTNWINPPATTQTPGVLPIATAAQAIGGTAPNRAMTPATHKAATDARFGTGAPSTFVKGLLSLATAALMRTALEIRGAALRDEGAGNGLDADKLDGEHGAYYLDYRNLSAVPTSFPPTAHGHDWSAIASKPATATRWPQWGEVAGKPSTFNPSSHNHAIAQVQGLRSDLDGRASLTESNVFTGSTQEFVMAEAELRLVSTAAAGLYIQVGRPGNNNGDLRFSGIGNADLDSFRVRMNGGNRDIFHSGNFDPDSKANLSGATFTGTVRAPIFRPTSSRKVKRNIRPMGYGLAEILRLRPVLWNPIDSEELRGGLVAEDAAKEFPVAVDSDSDIPGIDYAPIVAGLINAVQELHAELADLKGGVR